MRDKKIQLISIRPAQIARLFTSPGEQATAPMLPPVIVRWEVPRWSLEEARMMQDWIERGMSDGQPCVGMGGLVDKIFNLVEKLLEPDREFYVAFGQCMRERIATEAERSQE